MEDILSHFDIRISNLSPVIGRANPPDLTKLEPTLRFSCLYHTKEPISKRPILANLSVGLKF